MIDFQESLLILNDFEPFRVAPFCFFPFNSNAGYSRLSKWRSLVNRKLADYISSI